VASFESGWEAFGVRGRDKDGEESDVSRIPAILNILLPRSLRSARTVGRLEAE
jgi:hypothetical protein